MSQALQAFTCMAFASGLVLLIVMWADDAAMPLWWRRKYSAYATLFFPLVFIVAPFIAVWKSCTGIAWLISVATDEEE